MFSTRTISSWLLLGTAVLLHWQDPQPRQEPAKQEPAKQEPAKPQTPSPKNTRKVPGKPDRHALEGVYRLKVRILNGVPDKRPSRGYLAITSRHLFLNLASPGLNPEHPLVHAGVREWRQVGEDIRTTAKLDYVSDGNGVIHITPEGKQEARRIRIIQGGVRVMQGTHSWLEFERIE